MNLAELLQTIANCLNANQGILTALLFVFTLFLGWISGAFKAIRSKPKLKIKILEGPSFYSIVGTGHRHNDFVCHRTCVALYLWVANVGLSSTSVDRVRVGFHAKVSSWHMIRWVYLVPHTTLSDFQVVLGKSESSKLYPNLFQKSWAAGEPANKFLQRGATVSGMVYFEGDECYGAFHPRGSRRHARFKIVVLDPFGRKYRKRVRLPFRTLSEAREYNLQFGTSRADMNETERQVELETDQNGNLVKSRPIS